LDSKLLFTFRGQHVYDGILPVHSRDPGESVTKRCRTLSGHTVVEGKLQLTNDTDTKVVGRRGSRAKTLSLCFKRTPSGMMKTKKKL